MEATQKLFLLYIRVFYIFNFYIKYIIIYIFVNAWSTK